MNENKKSCDLCGLTVEVKGFALQTTEGEKVFCCEGCLGIYQMLHDDSLLPVQSEQTKESKK